MYIYTMHINIHIYTVHMTMFKHTHTGDSGIVCDMLWSDPQPALGRAPSKRGTVSDIPKSPVYPQKSPVYTQKSPIYPHKSPASPQRSPIYPQTSPINPQKSPIYPQKSPINPHKSPSSLPKSLTHHQRCTHYKICIYVYIYAMLACVGRRSTAYHTVCPNRLVECVCIHT